MPDEFKHHTNQGRDIDAVLAAVAIPDLEDVAQTAIWREVSNHPFTPYMPNCFCPAVEAVARLQELGYTITKDVQ